jgi:class 3 adenylate cyclase
VTVPTEDRRRVSVLFIDLVDFTRYAERADPELVRNLQSRFFATARRVVRQYGGVVEKYIGDAVMALFGAPVETGADALRCVRAGLELQRVLAGHGADAEHGRRFRVGVATGEALVDVAAARDGGQAIVAGDVVNTASRIQSVAPAGGVLVCGQTHALTSDAIRYAEQAPVTLRGRSSPSQVWLALAPVPGRQVGAEPDLTPLVGREHELALLAGALHRAIQDRVTQVVTVFGQAGIGKSRLVRELRRHADRLDHPVVWWTGHCRPFGENVTYAGLADIVKADAGILDTDTAAIAHDRLRRAARALVDAPEAGRLADALRPLVGLPGDSLPAEEAQSAWRRYLVAMAARAPTVLVFEDLHWADESMLRFLDLLATAAREVPLLLLATARPELVDRDGSRVGAITGSLTITLPGLRADGMATLYGHLLGRHSAISAAAAAEGPTAGRLRRLVELAGGNPLYAQEYVRMLVERGVAPRAARDGADDLPMPDGVHSVIANRVDLLEPADRSVLQAAAVVGMQFWPGAVAAALGRPSGSVERSLRRLEQREFVSERLESTVAGQSEFQFRHVLVRDVCYQRLPRTERVARHERTAEWLETLSRRRHSDLAEVLAHHRWTAHEIARTLGVPARRHARAARRALYLAARRAYALHAFDAATHHTDRALALLDAEAAPEPAAGTNGDPDGDGPHRRRPGGGVPDRLRLELFATEIGFYRDRAGFLVGDAVDRLQVLAEQLTGSADAGAGGERAAAAARAWTLLGQAAWLRGDRGAALGFLDRAVALFDPLPDSAEKIDAYAELGRLHMLDYECEPAIAAAGTAAAMALRLGLVEAQAQARITIATARYESGDPDGFEELRRVTDLCRRRQLLALRRATRNLSHLVREEGDWMRSEELLAESRLLDGPGSHNVLTDYAGEVMRAYFTGDFDALVSAAGSYRDSLWEDGRDLRACVRALRDDPAATSDATAALAAARASGFHRPLWAALAAAALCQAVQHRRVEAAELLTELTGGWQKLPVIASGEWVCKAANAAALTGPEPAEAMRAGLADAPRRTRWSEAALHTVTGAVALASGQPAEAGRRHLAAAEIHARTPAVTDRMLTLALAAAAFALAGEPDRAGPALREVRGFAQRNSAPGLLRIATSSRG